MAELARAARATACHARPASHDALDFPDLGIDSLDLLLKLGLLLGNLSPRVVDEHELVAVDVLQNAREIVRRVCEGACEHVSASTVRKRAGRCRPASSRARAAVAHAQQPGHQHIRANARTPTQLCAPTRPHTRTSGKWADSELGLASGTGT